MGRKPQTQLSIKLKQQNADLMFNSQMKGASDTQFKRVQTYHVMDDNMNVVRQSVTMDWFTDWAGKAARIYTLVPA